MELTKTRSTISETLEVVENGYKVTANVTIEKGVIKNLSGSVSKADEVNNNAPYGMSYTNWYANKQNGKWGTRIEWVANDENDVVSDLVVAVVDAVVAQYEVAE